MFEITGRQVRDLQGAGGELFTAFVDALLRSHCFVLGVRDTDIDTNIRTSISDGGVDTTIKQPVPTDTAGWLSDAPTAWQYKGTDYSNVRVDTLLEGRAIRERILEGYAFRLAIADSMPDDTRRDWERRLSEAARTINTNAPAARVVTADDLAAWASRYPALMMGRFHPNLRQVALHVEAWRKNVVADTPDFIPVGDWQPVQEALRRHFDLQVPPARAVMPVQGEAGVGKTRMAYEVVASISGAGPLVLYCEGGEAALRVAREVANDPSVVALVIADECDVEARVRMDQALVGHRERVRVIAIDNSGRRADGPQPEFVVPKMPRQALEQVLAKNFPSVSSDRRRAYATLAEGFPRLAASLCKDDARIAAAGHVGPAVPAIQDYLQVCLVPAQREALAALAMVTKVGYAGGVESELEQLCQVLGLARPVVEQALNQIHDRQGFVARTGRYFYVTPEVVAQVGCEDGWRRWGSDPEALLRKVPNEMVQAVLDRAWRSAPEEVRRACAAYFRDWAAGTTPEQLRDLDTVRRLVALVDTYPREYLPCVRRLIEAASLETLAEVRGEGPGDGTWGPRRALVWLAERFAQFPEFFDDAERILLWLAAAESEPKIANNATAVWCQLFRVYLSGTAVPFPERLQRLRMRLFEGPRTVQALGMVALEGVFTSHMSRTLGPTVVAGRIPPADWRPSTRAEEQGAFADALNLLYETKTLSSQLRGEAVRIAIEHTRWLIARGFFGPLLGFVSQIDLNDTELAALVEELDRAVLYDYSGQERRTRPIASTDLPTAVELARWRGSLVGRSLHTRLVASVGKDRWAASRVHAELRTTEGAERSFDDEILVLARELYGDREALRAELSWLTSESARSAAELGEALGRLDSRGDLIDEMMEVADKGPVRLLAQGYLHGLLGAHAETADRVAPWLDGIEQRAPEVAAELAVAAGPVVHALKRLLRMFDAGTISPGYLWHGNLVRAGGEPPAPEDLVPILQRLAAGAERGDEVAARVGLDLLAVRLPYDVPNEQPQLFREHPEVAQLAWRLLGARPAGRPPASQWWRQIVAALGRAEPARAADLASALLVSDDLGAAEEAEAVLIDLGARTPSEVMEALGRVMLDTKSGWRFFVGEHRALVAAIPEDVVRNWIQRAGIEGARRIARHLPPPHVDASGAPVVPPLTLWVLEEFEADDRTFHEFCAGVNSLKVYSGDIAAQHEDEAALARRFLDHSSRRVREWAGLEERSALEDAKRARRWEEESDLP